MSPSLGSFRDHFSEYAADYREFRPEYPPALFAFLASVAPGRELAWDCGTGNGQAAIGLAARFARVFATDASSQQIQQAEPHARIEYAVAPAERCPLPDRVVDLVLVAQALHWFDHDRFYAEVRRVCRPGAILAATCYYEAGVNADVNAVLARFQELVRPYWPPGREWVDAGYRTIPFPFPELAAPRFDMSISSDLPHFLGYLGTWSATKQYMKAHGSDPVSRFADEFAAAWGDAAMVRTVRWKFNVRLGRVD